MVIRDKSGLVDELKMVTVGDTRYDRIQSNNIKPEKAFWPLGNLPQIKLNC